MRFLRILAICLLVVLFQQLGAGFADQDLELTATVSAIGQNVPETYLDGLVVGSAVYGTITALNVDESLDGVQNGVNLVDLVMTIGAMGFDTPTNQRLEAALVQDGAVTGINFGTLPGGPVADPLLIFQTDGFMRVTVPGWNLSDPANHFYEVQFGNGYRVGVIPEPSTLLLAMTGVVGILRGRRRG
jgi:hypothetical protein